VIDMTDLRLFDLNLLVAFDALMAERNVTRAAGPGRLRSDSDIPEHEQSQGSGPDGLVNTLHGESETRRHQEGVGAGRPRPRLLLSVVRRRV